MVDGTKNVVSKIGDLGSKGYKKMYSLVGKSGLGNLTDKLGELKVKNKQKIKLIKKLIKGENVEERSLSEVEHFERLNPNHSSPR